MARFRTGEFIVVDDGSPAAESLVKSSEPLGNRVVVRATDGKARPEVEEVVVKRRKLTLDRAVAEAKDRGLLWVLMPRELQHPRKLLGHILRAEGVNSSEEVPGLAALMATPGRDRRYRNIMVVVDVRDEISSGLTVRAATGLAITTGANIDVALLGVDRNADLSSHERRAAAWKLGRQRDVLMGALEAARHHGIVARDFIPLGFPEDDGQAVMDMIAVGNYDAVIQDLGDVDLGSVRRRKALKNLFSADGGAGRLPLRVLTDAPCDVVLVVDDVRIGRLQAGLLKTGAMGAMAVGTLGVAVPASAAPASAAAASTASTSYVSAGDANAEKAEADTNKSEKDKGEKNKADKNKKNKKNKTEDIKVPEDVTREQVEKKEAAAANAAAAKEQAKADLDAAQKEAKALNKETKHISEAVSSTQMYEEQASYVATQAESEVAEAEQFLADTEASASGLSGVLGGASEEDVAQAEDELYQAEQELQSAEALEDAAHQEASEAYKEYQKFIEDVEEANQTATQAEKDLAKAKEKAANTSAEADAYAKVYEENNKTVRPATGEQTSPYGYRVHPISGVQKLHTGMDFAVGDGQIYAAADGTVTYAGFDSGGYGNLVKVDHGTIDGHSVETWYAHQSDLEVSVGDEVSAGEDIGNIGTTGSSTGLHLHFELRVDGEPVDPAPYLP